MTAADIRGRALSKGKNLLPFALTTLLNDDGKPATAKRRGATAEDMRLAREAATVKKGDAMKGIPDEIHNERMLVALGIRVLCDDTGAAIFQMSDLDTILGEEVSTDLMRLGMEISKGIQSAGN